MSNHEVEAAINSTLEEAAIQDVYVAPIITKTDAGNILAFLNRAVEGQGVIRNMDEALEISTIASKLRDYHRSPE
jgi:hypothetical protein